MKKGKKKEKDAGAGTQKMTSKGDFYIDADGGGGADTHAAGGGTSPSAALGGGLGSTVAGKRGDREGRRKKERRRDRSATPV